MAKKVLELKNISKNFKQADDDIEILKNANFTLYEGEMVCLVGSSGCGKSTVLNIAGLIDKAGSGEVEILGRECNGGSDVQRAEMRLDNVGFIFQFHHLIAELTAAENVALPLIIRGMDKNKAIKAASKLLVNFDIENYKDRQVTRLSGGEQQRVAIARAFITKPKLILADEPTGNLDPANSANVFNLLTYAVKKLNLSALVVTHNLSLASQADRIIMIKDKEILTK